MRCFTTLFLLGCCSSALALTPDDCTFYASFDGTYDAGQASGSGRAAAKGQMPFVPGIRGQGVLIGAPDTELSFGTQGHLSLEAGSVSVWLKPETWDDTDAAMRHFVNVNEGQVSTQEDGGTYFSLYRFFAHSTSGC